jgi:hypothetical protein
MSKLVSRLLILANRTRWSEVNWQLESRWESMWRQDRHIAFASQQYLRESLLSWLPSTKKAIVF